MMPKARCTFTYRWLIWRNVIQHCMARTFSSERLGGLPVNSQLMCDSDEHWTYTVLVQFPSSLKTSLCGSFDAFATESWCIYSTARLMECML